MARGAGTGTGEPLEKGDHQERRARFERYLLGTLDEQERAQVREAVIRDPDAFAELREVELDLLDAAADGTLDQPRTSVVEERLAADTRNHASALVALALAEHQKREQAKSVVRRGPSWWWSVALPAAAGVIIATGLGVFLLRGTFAPGGGPGSGEGAENPSTTAAARPPDAALDTVPRTDPLEPDSRAGAAAGAVPQQPPSTVAGGAPASSPNAAPGATAGAPPNATASLPEQPRTVALFLPVGTLRGARPSVRVPPSAETVRLELELDQPAPRFVGVTLRAVREPATADAPPDVWTAARVPVRVEGGQSIAAVAVPARALPTGVVEVHITAQSGAASTAAGSASTASTPIRTITFLVRRD